MACFALYETATGRLHSLGNVVVDPVPDGMTVMLVGDNPPDASVMWDEATRTFVPRPAKVLIDRLQDFLDRPGVQAVWDSLTPGQKIAVRDALIRILGPKRYRSPSAGIGIGE